MAGLLNLLLNDLGVVGMVGRAVGLLDVKRRNKKLGVGGGGGRVLLGRGGNVTLKASIGDDDWVVDVVFDSSSDGWTFSCGWPLSFAIVLLIASFNGSTRSPEFPDLLLNLKIQLQISNNSKRNFTNPFLFGNFLFLFRFFFFVSNVTSLWKMQSILKRSCSQLIKETN